MSGIDQYTKFLFHGNGDLSNSHHNLTYNNGVILDYVSTPVGSGAYYFDGDDDYISIPDSDDWNFGSGDFCIEGWVKNSNTINGSSVDDLRTICQFGQAESYNTLTCFIGEKPGWEGTKIGVWYYDGADYNTYTSDVITFNINTWYYISIVRNGNNIYFYLNGILSLTLTFTENISVGGETSVGTRYANGYGEYFNGYISDLRITKGEARYTSNFTPPTTRLQPDANTVLLLSGKGDYGTTGHSITTYNGVKESSDNYKFGNGAFYFDGTNDYLSVPDNEDWNFGSGDFTIDCWINPSAISSYREIIGQGRHSLNQRSFGLKIHDGKLNFSYSPNGTTHYDFESTNSVIYTSSWQHVAVTKNGADIRLFHNGSGVASETYSGSFYNVSDLVYIGAGEQATVNFYNGYIDELRISKDIARWTENFTPPTEEYSDIVLSSGTMGLFSWSNGTEENIASGTNFSQILEYVKLNPIYEGQWSTSDQKIYGRGYKINDKYNIDFYADSDRIYRTVHYESTEASGYNVAISGERFGAGIEGFMSYNFSEVI